MKSKLNIVLAILLVLQLAVIVVFDQPWSSGYSRTTYMTEEEKALFPGFSAETATSIAITRGAQKVALVKKSEDEWVVREDERDYRADVEWVVRLLESIGRTRKSDSVSSGEDKWPTYEVDAEKGIRVIVRDSADAVTADLVVGKTMGPMKGTFLRVGDSEDVILVTENVRRPVNKGKNWLRAWRDRTIHIDLKRRNFLSYRFDGPHGTVVLEHRFGDEGTEDDFWVMTEPLQGVVSEEQMGHLLMPVCGLKAKGFMPPGTKLSDVGLDPPAHTVTLEKKDVTLVFKISREGVIEGKKGICCLTASHEGDQIFKASSFLFLAYKTKPEVILSGSRDGESGKGDGR